jgi:hypothetical protein
MSTNDLRQDLTAASGWRTLSVATRMQYWDLPEQNFEADDRAVEQYVLSEQSSLVINPIQKRPITP